MVANNNTYRNWLRTLGAPEDPVATDTTSEWSLVSLVKALYLKITDGSFAAAVTGRAEGFVALCQSAVAQTATYSRSAKTSKVAAAASAVSASASAVSTAADAVTTAAQASLAVTAVAFASGTALFGQRAKKDRVAAAASATAAAASAASVPTSEQLVLPIQVYS